MRNLKFKYNNLKNTYARLEEACEVYDGKDDMIRDSVIQRFEFTYELVYRTLQEYMKYEGVILENSFPRTIFKTAYANNIIDNEKLWLGLIEDRNATSHIYSEKLADPIADRICKDYLVIIGNLVERLEKVIINDLL